MTGAASWSTHDLPDLTGRTVIVTGANSGVGYHAALALALAGADVTLAVRSADRGSEAAAGIRAAAPAATVGVEALDLADLASVRAFADRWSVAHSGGLDLLINNAGVMNTPARRTADGFELQFGTNHLGHFALTGLLLPALVARPRSRVVTVSSGVHWFGRMDFDDLMGERRYQGWKAYSQSKLANLLFTAELQRRLDLNAVHVRAMAAHPGYAATNLQSVGPRMSGQGWMESVMSATNRVLAQDASMGALPTLFAATVPGLPGNSYVGPDGPSEQRGYPRLVGRSKNARNRADAERLWLVSEDLTGVHYALGPPVMEGIGVTARRMPAEWEPHERTWMAWPSSGYTLGDTEEDADEARGCWAAVANAIARFEPVTMVVDPADVDVARGWLDPPVTILPAPLDDAWMRDVGPTFVREADGTVAGVDWVFNGWGAQPWAQWDNDARVAQIVSDEVGAPVIPSPLINEGGGIHVDGQGTVLLTRTVQLGEGRNADWTQEQVEDELRRTLGASRFVWLERGLTRDYDEFGTRGHVDIVACFADESTVLVHDQRDPEHPDAAVGAEVRALLESIPGLRVVPVPAPGVLRDDEGWVDYSYINHYICNGAVILCAFDDPGDDRAAAILREVYPGREIVLVDARPLFARGGGIHCITQQQPASTT